MRRYLAWVFTGLVFISVQAVAQPIDLGPSYSVSQQLTANNTTQATATLLRSQVSIFSTVASGGAAVLPDSGSAMVRIRVINNGANALLVYPSNGGQIDALGANVAYSIAAGSTADFQSVTSAAFDPPQWTSTSPSSVVSGPPSGGGGSSFTVTDQLNSGPLGSGVFNLNAINLPHWRAKLAGVRNKTGRARIILLGDSTTAGAGAGTGGTLNYNGAFAKNYPRDFASLLAGYIPTSDNSFFGDQTNNSVGYGAYDTRVTLGTGWSTTQLSFAGQMFKFTSGGGAGTLAFTPAGQIDTITVYYLQQSGSGSLTVNVDGGASLGTINQNGTGSLKTVTYTVTKGNHTVNLVPNNDAAVWIQGVVTYDSTTSAVDLIQGGSSGATAASFSSTSFIWNPIAVLGELAPDLTVICLTINDSNTPSTPIATYTTQMQAIITQALTTGDVILMVGAPSNTTQATDGTLAQYIAVLHQLAITNNVGLIDLAARWKSWAFTNPLMPYFDSKHPGQNGYWDIATTVYGAVTGGGR